MTEEEGEFGLVMPFVNVTSKGGPFDDQAFTAGYEMGMLSVNLANPHPAGWIHHIIVRTDNQEQADLLAMRHGWVAVFEDAEVDGWLDARFQRIGESK